MTTRFDEKNRRNIEDSKTLFIVVLLLIMGILGMGILSSLNDLHISWWSGIGP